MPRIVLFVLFLSLPTFAAKRDDCQLDLFKGQTARTTSRRRSPVKFEDLVFMQRRLWSLERQGRNQEADFLRHRLETQLRIAPRKEFVTKMHSHDLFRATPLAFFLFRAEVAGFKESFGYDFNQALGRPVRIPTTVSALDGAKQLWLFYEASDELLSHEDEARLNQAYRQDADLSLFNFLLVNSDHEGNFVLDPDYGVVVYDFGAAFRLPLRYFVHATLPKEKRPKEATEIVLDDVVKMVKEKLAMAKFDWKTALNRLDPQEIASRARQKLGPVEAREFLARICFLKTLLNGGSPARCRAL